MPNRPDAIDTQLRALTRRVFDDTVLVRRRRGRLVTRGWRLSPVLAAVTLAAAVGIVGALASLRFHQGNGAPVPAVQTTQSPAPTPHASAGAPPAQVPLTQMDDALEDVAVDGAGNVYLAEGWHRRVVKVTRDGVPSLLAGPAPSGSVPRERGPAATGIFGDVLDVAVDASGNVYVLDAQLGVRRISPDGTISTVARDKGSPAFAGVPDPSVGGSIAVTASGTVYVACGGCHPPGSQATSDVYAITTDGSVRVVAGGGRPVTGEMAAGLAPGATGSTLLALPLGVAVDVRGDVFIADSGNNRIREIGVDGHVATVAGNDQGTPGSSGDGGPATQAALNDPVRIAVDAAGNLFIFDASHGPVREVTDGTIRTLDATGAQGPPAAALPASEALKAFFTIWGPKHLRATGPDGSIVTVF